VTETAEILRWVTLLKGDAPGHPFRGNQYSVIGSVSDHTNERADGLARQVAATVNPTPNTRMAFVRRHEQLVGIHRALQMQLTEAAKGAKDKRVGRELREAAELHGDAANAHVYAANAHAQIVAPVKGQDEMTGEHAARLSREAADVSDHADRQTDDGLSQAAIAEGLQRGPRASSRPKEEQLQFRYDEPMVHKRSVSKGDVEGHEFHGNQYGGGSYERALTEAGIDPREQITRGTDISKLLDDLAESGAGGGHGYSRVRDWEGTSSRGVRLGDSMLKAFATRNGWTVHDLMVFADSKPGRHFGDFVTGQRAADARAQGADYLESGARILGLPVRRDA